MSETTAESKSRIRKIYIKRRNGLSENLVALKSKAIKDHLLQLPALLNAKTIMAYLSFDNEVRTDEIISELIKNGKTVCVPKLFGKKMVPYRIFSMNEDFIIDRYGIREPQNDISREVYLKDLDVVIVPGVVFDLEGGRYGYGGGYYDRFLIALKPTAKKIAIAFNLQVRKKIPLSQSDIRVDSLITESGIIF
ncbi:MAG: 5-formyltetrahydrofolate cyclo-ligase [Actinobacteria bacterium]|nr:5-formyltetrahydrofolate cyclo-ligase [Actinomycetota bacterium]